MKYILTFLLVISAALLGCSKVPDEKLDIAEPVEAKVEETYEPGEWTESWELAMQTARESGKTVLVNFTGSDWCGWCIRLKSEVFDHKEFKDYAKENLVLLKLDFPRSIYQTPELKRQNGQLQQAFGIRGYPTILLLNAEGKEIGRTGYQPGGPDKYVEHLQGFIK